MGPLSLGGPPQGGDWLWVCFSLIQTLKKSQWGQCSLSRRFCFSPMFIPVANAVWNNTEGLEAPAGPCEQLTLCLWASSCSCAGLRVPSKLEMRLQPRLRVNTASRDLQTLSACFWDSWGRLQVPSLPPTWR